MENFNLDHFNPLITMDPASFVVVCCVGHVVWMLANWLARMVFFNKIETENGPRGCLSLHFPDHLKWSHIIWYLTQLVGAPWLLTEMLEYFETKHCMKRGADLIIDSLWVLFGVSFSALSATISTFCLSDFSLINHVYSHEMVGVRVTVITPDWLT